MIKHNVSIVANKKLKGFDSYDDGEWIKEKEYTGLDISDIIRQINEEYNITETYSIDIDDEYATYKADVGGIVYIIDID